MRPLLVERGTEGERNSGALGGRRCGIEAGVARLLAARVAWSNADASLQIHGRNGYAPEYESSRILCDARILKIFEGAAEIQAQLAGCGLPTRMEPSLT